MGLSFDRIFKYYMIAQAFAGAGMAIFGWLKTSQSEGSPGGSEITLEEVSKIDEAVNMKINEGLMAAGLPLRFTGGLEYTGE